MGETTAERLKRHLDTNAKEYYAPIIEKGDVGMTETDAERLASVKAAIKRMYEKELKNKRTIEDEDMVWYNDARFLVEQAERAQELEKENRLIYEDSMWMMNENKRLREALEQTK